MFVIIVESRDKRRALFGRTRKVLTNTKPHPKRRKSEIFDDKSEEPVSSH